MRGKTISEIKKGDEASFTRTITEAEVYAFAGVTGDLNPVHIDEKYAKGTVFGQRIAHGILCTGMISKVLGNQLPGPGSVYLQQTCIFKKPVFMDDTITATVKVIETDLQRNRVLLRTYCSNQNGELTLDGEATLTMIDLEAE